VNLEAIKSYLLTFGIPGLLVISFLDSAGVPLPGGVDLVVMLLSWQKPALFVPIALVASLGSTAGCFVLYRIARSGGDRLMDRFPVRRQEWVKEKVRRNDLLSVLLAMLGPPPFPTKLFILVAGVVRMNWRRFGMAVFLGRFVRFLGEAYLAVRVGSRAADVLKEQYPLIAAALVAGAALFLLGRRWMERARKLDRARELARDLLPEIQSMMASCDPASPSGGTPLAAVQFPRVRAQLPAILPKEQLFAVETFYQSVEAFRDAMSEMTAAFAKESDRSLGDRVRAKDRRDRCLRDLYQTGEAALERLRSL
jgi:membrane protein YqaA with SNARE-associated domain